MIHTSRSRPILAWLPTLLAASITGAAEADPAPADPTPVTVQLICPIGFPAAPPAERARRQTEAARLSGLNDACQQRPDYFAYHGALLLTLKQPQEAAIALEKALLLAPDLAGAQLDYAQALAELGELTPARQLAGEVARRPDAPKGVQSWLYDQLGSWRGEGWRLGWSWDWLAGTERNLNSAPGIRYLTLTLPGGNVPLELDNIEDPQPGSALKSDLLIAAAHRLGKGVIQLGGEHLQRHSPGRSASRQELTSAHLAYLHPLWNGRWGLRLEDTRVRLAAAPAYLGSGWNLYYQLPASLLPTGCSLNLGRVGEQRRYPGAEHQNGHYRAMLLHQSCQRGDGRLQFSLQHGTDRAVAPQRLGGDQRRTDASLSLGQRLGDERLTLTLAASRAADRQNYSALLGNQPRRTERLSLRLHWEHPLTPHLSLIGQAERSAQHSNIDLFGMRNSTLYFGLRLHGE